MRKAALLCISLFFFGQSWAETGYVTDSLKITMRSGESTSHKILRMLPSGTAVQVMGRNADNGYSRVKVDDQIGFILSRHLMNEPSARDQLAGLTQRLKDLQEAPDKLQSRLSALQDEHEKLRTSHDELQRIKQQLERDLGSIRRTSADAVRISNERNELRKTVASLTREREELKQENRDLNNQTAQHWFMIGAGVIILGIILGLILPHLRFQRRKSSWGTL